MKRLILGLLMAIPMVVSAQTNQLDDDFDSVVDKAMEFSELVRAQKVQWMQFARDEMSEKMDLKRKHKEQEFDLRKAMFRKMVAHCKEGTVTADMLREKLDEFMEFYRRQREEWREFGERCHDRAKELGMKQQEELDEFTDKL